jgi:hypothetical protein
MNTRGDKRASKSAVRREHQADNYVDLLGTTAADWFAPYAKNFVMIATGNHEAAVNKFCEVNLIERLVCLLNAKTGSSIHNGGFSGWVVFTFRAPRTGRDRSTQVVLHYDHGYGGGGAVTKDLIQASRRAVYLPDADIVASGHVHEFWQTPFARLRLRQDFSVGHDRQMHIKIPTYKEEYKDGFSGWHPERGGPPKVTGAVWLRFYWSTKEKRVLYEVIEAR